MACSKAFSLIGVLVDLSETRNRIRHQRGAYGAEDGIFVKLLKDGGLMTKRGKIGCIISSFVAYFSVAGKAAAITLPELASRVESMSRTEREALIIKGAREACGSSQV